MGLRDLREPGVSEKVDGEGWPAMDHRQKSWSGLATLGDELECALDYLEILSSACASPDGAGRHSRQSAQVAGRGLAR